MLSAYGKCLSAMARWIKKITQLLKTANLNQMHCMGPRKKKKIFSSSCYKTVKMALWLPQRLYK